MSHAAIPRFIDRIMRLARVFAALCMAIVAVGVGGCKTVDEGFSGLRGFIAPGILEGASVKVFDGSLFVGPSATNGLLATGTVDAVGQFDLELPDASIGRTLLVFVEFPVDNPLTTADERVIYRPFDAGGAEIRMNPSDGPWVAVVDFFEGLAAPVTVSPLTTATYYAISGMSATEAGPGNARWNQPLTQGATLAMGRTFGLSGDAARIIPVRSMAYGGVVPRYTEIELIGRSITHTHILMQLERAANAFAVATTDASDDLRTFYSGLWADASDGVLDGRAFGVPVTNFVQPGAPSFTDLVTNDASFSAARYLRDSGIVTVAEVDGLKAIAPAVVMSPTAADVLADQLAATGAVRGTVIESIDTKVVPSNGQIDITVRGRGFIHQPSIVFSPVSNFPIGASALVTVSATSTDTGGSILSVAHDQIVVRTPRFDLTTTPLPLRRSTTSPASPMDIFLRTDNNGVLPLGEIDINAGRVTQLRSEGIVVLNARMVRLAAALSISGAPLPQDASASALLALYPAATDPNTLDAATDPVNAVEMRLFNASSVALSEFAITNESTLTSLVGTSPTFGNFGDAGTPLLTFSSDATQRANSITLTSGGTAWMAAPFVIDQGQVGSGPGHIPVGAVLRFRPQLRATASPGGGQVTTTIADHIPVIRAEGSPALAAQNPVATIESTSIPAAALANTATTYTINLLVQGQAAGLYRELLIERIEVEGAVAFTNDLPFEANLVTRPTAFPRQPGAMHINTFSIRDSNSNEIDTIPFTIAPAPTPNAGRAAINFTMSADQATVGQSIDLTFRITWRDRTGSQSGVLTATHTVAIANP